MPDGGAVPPDDGAVAPDDGREPEPVPLGDVGDGVGEPPDDGEDPLVYKAPLAEYVMNVLICGCEVPVRLGPEKQMTTSSWVPPSGVWPTAWIAEMGACSVPLNGAEVPFTTRETELVVPSA